MNIPLQIQIAELESKIDAIPQHVYGKSTEEVTQPLRSFLEELRRGGLQGDVFASTGVPIATIHYPPLDLSETLSQTSDVPSHPAPIEWGGSLQVIPVL